LGHLTLSVFLGEAVFGTVFNKFVYIGFAFLTGPRHGGDATTDHPFVPKGFDTDVITFHALSTTYAIEFFLLEFSSQFSRHLF